MDSFLHKLLLTSAPSNVRDQVGERMRGLSTSGLTYDEALAAAHLLLHTVRAASEASTARYRAEAKSFTGQARFGEMPS